MEVVISIMQLNVPQQHIRHQATMINQNNAVVCTRIEQASTQVATIAVPIRHLSPLASVFEFHSCFRLFCINVLTDNTNKYTVYYTQIINVTIKIV